MPRATLATAQHFEQVAQVNAAHVHLRAGAVAATRVKMRLPSGRRAEILTRVVAAELVVGCALFLVGQRLVGLGHGLEFFLGVLFLGHVRMVFAGEPAVRLLDVFIRGAALDPEGGVIVLVFHGVTSFISSRCQRRMRISSHGTPNP